MCRWIKRVRLITTINSKEPYAEPDDMKSWWRIFYAAQEKLDRAQHQLGGGELGAVQRG
jgi:hypothetical protein